MTIIDNTKKWEAEYEEALLKAMERIGLKGEDYAMGLVPVDTSALKQSITHKVIPDEPSVIIGTNNEYAPYVELGTGKFKEGGGGRPGWWVYVKGGSGGGSDKGTGKIYTQQEAAQVVAILRSKGLDAYMTQGQEPQPYLRPAAKDHMGTYSNILKDELENA